MPAVARKLVWKYLGKFVDILVDNRLMIKREQNLIKQVLGHDRFSFSDSKYGQNLPLLGPIGKSALNIAPVPHV